jgi:hypothetical protein
MKIEIGKTYKFKILDKREIENMVFLERVVLPCWSDKEKMAFLHLCHKDDLNMVEKWHNDGSIKYVTAKVERIFSYPSSCDSLMYHSIIVYQKSVDIS